MSDIKNLLGKRIKEIRKEKNLTQEQLAEKAHLEPMSLSNIENGKRYPAPETLDKLSKALDVPPSSLFTFEHLNTPPLDVMIEEVREAMAKDEVLAHQLYMTCKNLSY